MKKKIIILGVNADIGFNICKYYLDRGDEIIGTYRKKKPDIDTSFFKNRSKFLKCDVTKAKELNKLKNFISKKNFKWDLLFSSVGTTEPIDLFFNTNFKQWEKSFNVNMISQLKVIHMLHPLRNKKKICNIALLAGGGTNNPFRYYSAYCLSKIALIKMCELIYDENKDLNIFIIGPGYTRTKGHLETLKAGRRIGNHYYTVKKFWQSGKQGTSFKKIFDCINWCIKVGPKTVSGRNISVVHDNWGTKKLKINLVKFDDMYKLRRFKNN
jgi:NAD(P)-dependent dehydrogenase (short-subunit alcohol dehydrogenase family)